MEYKLPSMHHNCTNKFLEIRKLQSPGSNNILHNKIKHCIMGQSTVPPAI